MWRYEKKIYWMMKQIQSILRNVVASLTSIINLSQIESQQNWNNFKNTLKLINKHNMTAEA